jgi:hypothetical protein
MAARRAPGSAGGPDIAAQVNHYNSLILQADRYFVTVLAANGGLRDGLDPQRAADIVFGLLSHELYGCRSSSRAGRTQTGSGGSPTRWPRNFCPQAERNPARFPRSCRSERGGRCPSGPPPARPL